MVTIVAAAVAVGGTAAADAGDAADSVNPGVVMAAAHTLLWGSAGARRGAACGRDDTIDLDVEVDSPTDRPTILHLLLCARCRLSLAVAGAVLRVDFVTDARSTAAGLWRAFWSAAGAAASKVRRGATSYIPAYSSLVVILLHPNLLSVELKMGHSVLVLSLVCNPGVAIA